MFVSNAHVHLPVCLFMCGYAFNYLAAKKTSNRVNDELIWVGVEKRRKLGGIYLQCKVIWCEYIIIC